jgi:hypothetical protein
MLLTMAGQKESQPHGKAGSTHQDKKRGLACHMKIKAIP